MMKFVNLLSRASGIIEKFSLKVKTFHLGHFRNIFYRFKIQIFKNLDRDNQRKAVLKPPYVAFNYNISFPWST